MNNINRAEEIKPLKPLSSPMTYEEYHYDSLAIGDIDPSYEMLRYVCDRFELSMEQRYWLGFLYSTCYCGATVFYIYNEFPDFENVDEGRLERWWRENKKNCVFQTDRLRVKTGNHFVSMFRSYHDWVRPMPSQEYKWRLMLSSDPYLNYDLAYESASEIFQMGRFSLFLFLEAVHVVTGFHMKPRSMDLRHAESCRNGLAEAIGRPEFNTHGGNLRISPKDMAFLQAQFDALVERMTKADPRNNVWNIETTLCAYKKYLLGNRWVGYYLDRQHAEITKMQSLVRRGVDWDVFGNTAKRLTWPLT